MKPGDVAGVLETCAPALPDQALVLSIAAGVRIATLEAAAPGPPGRAGDAQHARAVVGKGAAAIAAGTLADDTHLELAERVLGAVGTVVRVPEAQLDAVTGLSGSGPAYLFLLAEAMTDAGVLVGLPRATADALVRQTLLGAATLLSEGDETPESLRAAVTSPGGTTAAALQALETHGVARRAARRGRGRDPPFARVGRGRMTRRPRSRLPPKLPDPARERGAAGRAAGRRRANA